MPKLKVYSIGNIDGRHAVIVAASSKTAACEALRVRGNSKSEVVILDDDPGPFYGDGSTLALATPGIAWKRSICGEPDSGRPWCCTDRVAGDRAIVRSRFPEAFEYQRGELGGDWVIYSGLSSSEVIGTAATEGAAWIEAARRLLIEGNRWNPGRTVLVWRSEDAPEAVRGLAEDGRSGALIIFVPAGMEDAARPILDAMESGHYLFAARHPVKDGTVFIGRET